MILLPLGTNGFLPGGGRQTMSFLLHGDGRALLLDAGSGVCRLLEPEIRARWPLPGRLDVVLTHYHLDHVIGLSYLPGVARGVPVRIFAPAPPLVEGGPEALDRLVSPPLFPKTFAQWPMPVEVVAYSGGEIEVDGLRFTTRAQRHPGGSVGLRLGDAFAYVTDTVADPGTVELVRGVGLLLHEVWSTDAEAAAEDPAVSGHSALSAVAGLARAAQVGVLMPVHHRPVRSAGQLDEIVAGLERTGGVASRLPLEGVPIELPG